MTADQETLATITPRKRENIGGELRPESRPRNNTEDDSRRTSCAIRCDYERARIGATYDFLAANASTQCIGDVAVKC